MSAVPRDFSNQADGGRVTAILAVEGFSSNGSVRLPICNDVQKGARWAGDRGRALYCK